METNWWQYAERVRNEAGETRTQSAERVGINLSNYTRWAAGTLPKPEVAVRFARAYGENVLNALVALGLITEEEASLTERTISKRDFLASLTDVDLATAILDRAKANEDSMLNAPLEGRILSVVEDNLDSEDFLSEPYAANQPGYSPRDEQEPDWT